MSNATTGDQRAKRHAQQLAYLRAKPDLLATLPGVNDDPTSAQHEALDLAVREMQHVRLYSPTTAATNVRWGIRLLVSEIRGEAISGKELRWATKGARGADVE